MHISITYFTFAWPELIIGLVPATCFLKDLKPKKWHRAPMLDAIGWVVIVTIFYLSSALQLVFGVHAPDRLSAIIDLILLALVDALIWHRLIYFKRYSKEYNKLHNQINS